MPVESDEALRSSKVLEWERVWMRRGDESLEEKSRRDRKGGKSLPTKLCGTGRVSEKPLKVLLLDASTQAEGSRKGPIAWRQGKWVTVPGGWNGR